MTTGRRSLRTLAVAGILAALVIAAVPAAQAAEAYRGRTLPDALHRLQELGLRMVFSSDLVRPDMRVESEPASRWPREILAEILEPHGLESRDGPGEVLLVVKAPPQGNIRGTVVDARTSKGIAGVRVVIVGANLEMVTDAEGRFRTERMPAGAYTVEASHDAYFAGDLSGVPVADRQSTEVRMALAGQDAPGEHVLVSASDPAARRSEPAPVEPLDAERLRGTPKATSDPLRALDPLPGVATHEASSQINVRGGAANEVQIMVDGLELYEPFHLKDRQGLVSIIDEETVAGIDFYGGSFPVEFGGRMSGVIDIASADPDGKPRTDIGIRTDGVRLANQGTFQEGRGGWMVSARRGNPNDLQRALDTDPSYAPSYYDAFGKVGFEAGDRTVMSFSFLGAVDRLQGEDGAQIETQDGPGEFRSISSDQYAWMTVRNLWSARLFSESTLSYGTLSFKRSGSGGGVTSVGDRRATDMVGLKQSWAFSTGRHLLKWGFDVKHLDARYDYAATLDPPAAGSGPVETRIAGAPSGQDVSVYVADRIEVRPDLRIELGLRWERQTYAPDGGSLSPRMNVVYDVAGRSRLRAAWGLFNQAQRISELQVEDGIAAFRPAQRAEHRLIGFDQGFGRGYELRVSAYQKIFRDLSPRYENLWDPYGFFPEAQLDRVRIDPDGAEVRGLELGLTSPSGRPVSWWTSYTLASAWDEIGGENVPRAWDQRHALSAGVRYLLRERWSFGVAGTYRSGRPTTSLTVQTVQASDGTAQAVPVPGPRNQDRLPAFHRLDFRVSRLIPLQRMQFRVTMDVTNVYGSGNVAAGYRLTRLPDGQLAVAPGASLALPRIVTLGFHWTF